MIFDKISNAHYYKSKSLQSILEAIKNVDLTKSGKVLLDDGVFFNILNYNTTPTDNRTYEGHIKYIDVQIILKGKEIISIANSQDLKLTDEYDSNKDIMFYESKGSDILVNTGEFMVLFPDDLHAPGIGDGQAVCKVVGKIPVDKF